MPTLSELKSKADRGTTIGARATGALTFSDLKSLPRQQTEEFDVNGIANVTEDQRQEWRKQGPIGWVEQWRRADKTEMIPFNPERAIKAVGLYKTVKRIQADKYEDNLEQKQKDIEQVNQFLVKTAEERERGFTLGGKINQGVTELPGFMVEFLATGGLASLGKKAVTKGVTAVAGKATQKGAVKLATNVTGTIAGAGVRTLGMPHRVASGFADRQLNASLELTDKGVKIAQESLEKPHVSFAKAIGDVTIENFSEVTGPALSKLGSKLLPAKFKEGIAKVFIKLHPNESIVKIATAAGYNGFLEELGEERVAALLRATMGVDDFGAENPERVFDRIVASVPNGEELLVEAGVLAFPGAVNVGAQQTMQVIFRRKNGKDVVELIQETPAQQKAKTDKAQTISDEIAEKIINAPEEVATVPIETKPVKELTEQEQVNQSIEQKTKGRIEAFQVEQGRKADQVDKLQSEVNSINDVLKDIREGDKFKEKKLIETQLLERRIELQEKIADLKPGFVRRRELTLLRQQLSDIRKGIRQGTQQTKQEVSDVQTQVINVLQNSKLDVNDKAKFIKTIKNIQTQNQLTKALPQIEQRVQDLESKAAVRSLKTRIKKILNRTKPTAQAGKPKGKFGPDIQRILDKARRASKLSKEQAQAELISRIGTEPPTAEQALENRILQMFAGFETQTPEQLEAIVEELDALTSTGRAISALSAMDQKAREEQLVEDALITLIGDKPPDPRNIPNFITELGKSLRTFGKSLSGWDDMMDIISQDDKTSKQGESKLSRAMSVTAIEQREKGAVRKSSEKMIKIGLKAFGFTKETQLLNQLREDSRVRNLGDFTNTAGEVVPLMLSKAQARKRWMEFQDPTLRETLTSPDANAYSQDMIDALSSFLTAEDIAFAKGQLQFYREFYQKINKVYSRVYGIDLPFNEFYSPISRDVAKETVADEFLQEIDFRRSIAPGSLISRVENLRPIKEQSDIDVLQRHIMEMEHFMTWIDKIRDINAVFTDNRVKKVIEQKFGKTTLSVIRGFIQDFTRGGVERSRAYQGIIDTLRINYTVSALALKPALTVKQMVSMFAFAEFVPSAHYLKSVLALPVNFNKKMDLLRNSELMKARGQTITRDIRDALQSNEFKLFKESNKFRDLLLFTTRLGDRGAILLGGWSVYDYHKNTLGKTHEQALAEFEKATAATQQSSDLSQLSEWQRGGPLAKLFTMFTSAQNQYFRRMVGAIRNVGAQRISVGDFAKKIFIYNWLLPILFQWVSQLGRFDDEKEPLLTGMLGSFNGMFILGDILDTIMRTAAIEFADMDVSRFDPNIPPLETYRGIEKSITGFADAVDFEDVLEAIGDLSAGTVGPITGLPIKQILDFYEGGSDLVDDNIPEGTLKLMGWSPYVVNQRFE